LFLFVLFVFICFYLFLLLIAADQESKKIKVKIKQKIYINTLRDIASRKETKFSSMNVSHQNIYHTNLAIYNITISIYYEICPIPSLSKTHSVIFKNWFINKLINSVRKYNFV